MQLLKYLNEFNYMLATTSRRQLLVYKYNPSGCLTSLKYKQPLDSICYTSKVPILIFTGDSNGSVCKWEQQQLNQLIYASESLLKSELVQKESSKIQGQILIKKPNQNDDTTNNPDSNANDTENNKHVAPIKKTNIILKMVFVECLDLLLAASEDGNIYVWGFDQEAVKILKNMKYTEDKERLEEKNLDYFQTYLKNIRRVREVIIDDAENEQDDLAKTSNKLETDSVTNRVAGFILKKILSEHSSCVTSLIVIDRLDLYSNRYLLSAGWDRRICIWDLDKLRLYDLFRNKNVNSYEEVELASDGNILDMCYCEKYNLFAYASTDSMVYVRKFSTYGSEMTLVNTLQGLDLFYFYFFI
jgi:WD40 repeat protein